MERRKRDFRSEHKGKGKGVKVGWRKRLWKTDTSKKKREFSKSLIFSYRKTDKNGSEEEKWVVKKG